MEAVNQAWSARSWASSIGEETANSLTHGAGLLLGICGLWQLLSTATSHGTFGQVAGVAVFGGSMVVVYFASTVFHLVERSDLKKRLQICDHAAIYVMIAGTYTPFLLALPGPWRSWGLGAVWLMAALGVGFKLTMGVKQARLSTMMYLAMGWMGLLAIPALLEHISTGGVAWLLAGGLAYTFGTLFYIRPEVRYSHAVWHVFVVIGTVLHYGAILLYVVPMRVA